MMPLTYSGYDITRIACTVIRPCRPWIKRASVPVSDAQQQRTSALGIRRAAGETPRVTAAGYVWA
jgi:hypothetical protein